MITYNKEAYSHTFPDSQITLLYDFIQDGTLNVQQRQLQNLALRALSQKIQRNCWLLLLSGKMQNKFAVFDRRAPFKKYRRFTTGRDELKMDSLEKQLLLREAEKYGYQLVGTQSSDPAKVLQQMVESNDGRVLEGIPVVLTNMLLKDGGIDCHAAEKKMPQALQKRFRILACVTFYFLLWVPESDAARAKLHKYLKQREPSLLETVQEKLQERGRLNVGAGVALDVERLENAYRNYVLHQMLEKEKSLTRRVEQNREQALSDALAELFTDKQRALIVKTLQGEQLTKTEREYYSRVVKPRMKALRNSDLQALAATLLG